MATVILQNAKRTKGVPKYKLRVTAVLVLLALSVALNVYLLVPHA